MTEPNAFDVLAKVETPWQAALIRRSLEITLDSGKDVLDPVTQEGLEAFRLALNDYFRAKFREKV